MSLKQTADSTSRLQLIVLCWLEILNKEVVQCVRVCITEMVKSIGEIP